MEKTDKSAEETIEETIEDVLGIHIGAPPLTPTDYGETKLCMERYAANQLSEHKERLKTEMNKFRSGIHVIGIDYLIELVDKLQPTTSNNSVSEYKEVIKELLPLAQNFASTLRWDEEYSGDEVGGKEAQEIVDRAKALLQGSNQGQPQPE